MRLGRLGDPALSDVERTVQRDIFRTAEREGSLPGGRRELGLRLRISSFNAETVRLSVFLCIPSSRAALL